MARLIPIVLLFGSNVFMTIGWYAHLKHHRDSPLLYVVLVSWGIALLEYLLQVPANRLGMDVGYSLAQLKTIQEAVTLTVFVAFMRLYFGQNLAWNHLVGFALIALGAVFVFKPW